MSDLQLVTLYGQGAVNVMAGQTVFRAVDGVLRVPANLVRQAEAAGYRRTQSGQSNAAAGIIIEPPAAPVVDPVVTPPKTETLDEKIARYRAEVVERGYKGDAVEAIVAERLQYDDLIAEGKTDEEASAIVWGGSQDDGEAKVIVQTNTPDAEAAVNTDVTALSADALAVDTTE